MFRSGSGRTRGGARSGCGQAIKGVRGMSWCQQASKDVVSCDKPRGAASKRYIRGSPMGQPAVSSHGVRA